MIAHVACVDELEDGCEGPITVSHGQVVTQLRYGNEPSPSQKTWNSMTGPALFADDSPRRYSRTDWTRENVCGRDEDQIGPQDGEVPYRSGVLIKTNKDGSRSAAFVKGSDEDISDIRATHAIIDLLDSVTDIQIAQEEGDAEALKAAEDNIASYGFSEVITAGRNDGKRK